MTDAQAVETGQFSTFGHPHQPDNSFIGYYEPAPADKLMASGRLYLVADGLGSTGSGAVAAQFAIRKILHDFYHAPELDLEKRLLEVIRQTNTAVYERNQRFPDRRPIAAHLTAALIHHNKLFVANVGDGRVYAVWDQDIEQLTPAKGEPQPEARAKTVPLAQENRSLPPRQRLPEALGIDEKVNIETFSRRLFAGDIVVLTNGGLTGYVTEAEIAQTVTQYPPQQAGQRLSELAARRGSREVVSVSITRLLAQPAAGAALSAKPLTLPVAPDWDKLARPVTQPQPKPAPAAQTQSLNLPIKPRRFGWRRPAFIAITVLILAAALGWATRSTWQDWLGLAGAPQVSTTDAPVSYVTETAVSPDTRSSQNTSPLSPTETPESSAPATTEGGLGTESSSPLPTPTVSAVAPAGASAGDEISVTVSANSAGAATATVTPSGPATPSPTPLPTIELPSDCTNKGRFAGDVTVKDGQEFPAGAQFDKVWSVTNYGTCPWGPGYTVRFVEGDRMSGESQTIIEIVQSGDSGEVTVPLVAPKTEGTYQATWQLHSLTGEPFGPELYVEIEVAPGALPPLAESELTVLYDFVQNAAQASWLAGETTYQVTEVPINRSLVIPFPQGLVAIGEAEFGGNYIAPGEVLLTHPHQELGLIEGTYPVDTPLQPEDILIATLGFPKAAIINDDGVIFEISFKPEDEQEQVVFSKLVKYEDSPVTVRQQLTDLEPNQTGSFILRVRGGDSLSYDWAVWIDLRLVRQ